MDNQSKVDNQVKFNDGIFYFIVIVNWENLVLSELALKLLCYDLLNELGQ